MSNEKDVIHTRIWCEEPEQDNAFAAEKCYCSGFDVYGELLGKVSWHEYLYLLFRLELPNPQQTRLLELISVAIANPGIRDHSVRAAMNAGVGGSTRASALVAALTVGAGNLGGAHEIVEMVRLWCQHETDLGLWTHYIRNGLAPERTDVWHPMEHIPGFDPNGVSCPQPVLQTLDVLACHSPGVRLAWLKNQRPTIEQLVGYPLSMSGVIATALVDLGFDEAQAEMLYLMLRLPGAAAHALEQEGEGWRRYPFFGSDIKHMEDAEYRVLMKSLETVNDR